MAVHPPTREYRTWPFDSRRWAHIRHRPDDIVIATYPKCGTTWTQRIVQMLVFGTPEPIPLSEASAWPDQRVGEPLDVLLARIEAQAHRRFFKSHMPLDGLPFHDEVKYIHVARDGRDANLSWHGHAANFRPEVIERLDAAGLGDETIARPYPPRLDDPADTFHRWLTEAAVPGDADGLPHMSWFHFHKTWWTARDRPNVLMVHFADLKADLGGEMRRIADFLGIEVAPPLLPAMVERAGFAAMREDGDKVLGKLGGFFKGGGPSFFSKGENRRWEGIFRADDLALYDRKVAQSFTPDCARWLAGGRLAMAASA